jgi:hypothetical protein
LDDKAVMRNSAASDLVPIASRSGLFAFIRVNSSFPTPRSWGDWTKKGGNAN